jgi:hypothetical protein
MKVTEFITFEILQGVVHAKESPATNNQLQETDRKTQQTMGRRNERECREVT